MKETTINQSLPNEVPAKFTRNRGANRITLSEITRRERISESLAKSYVLRSPGGEQIEITNLRQWCQAQGFTKTQYLKMGHVVTHKARSCQGWSLWVEPGQESIFRKVGYELCSPSGEKVVVISMKDFCVANGFNASGWAAMRRLTTGIRKSPVNGWSLWVNVITQA